MTELSAPLAAICHAVDGALAATVMGMDGLPVDTYSPAGLAEAKAEIDVSSLLVEYSSVLAQVRSSAQMFAAGGLEELSIHSTNLTTLIRPITAEYFVALALRPASLVGKGRYLLRIHAPKLARVLV